MSIADFYANKVVFITGGTGFLGKAIIEKLLRSCPGIVKIYMLVRAKKGQKAQERIEFMVKDLGFRKLWKENPEVFTKIEPIEGDCCELGLGISRDDMERLSDVSIIIHSAATVRFDEPLREAIIMNTRGTHELLNIALNFRNLKAFVHISTAYSNPSENVVYEKVYEPNADWRDVIKLAENVDTETLNTLWIKLSNNYPNTYTYTKGLGEKLVSDYKEKVPVLIFRPAIVMSALEEPFPGWIENLNGPVGALLMCGTGIKRSDYCEPDVRMSIVPVDVVVRGLLVSCYKLGTRDKSITSNEIDVYNCAVDKQSPLTIRELFRNGEAKVKQVPLETTVWKPGGIMFRSMFLYLLQILLIEVPFAIVLDGLLYVNGRKPKIVKVKRLCVNASKALKYFMWNEWDFKTEKFLELENVVSKEEKGDFGFFSSCYIHFDKYSVDIIHGFRECILKEPREPTPAAHRRMAIFIVVHYIVQGIFFYFLFKFLYGWIQ